MKLFGKLLIAVLVLAVLLPFTILKGKDGKPLMSISNIKMPDLSLPKIPDAVKNTEFSTGSGSKDIIYKWRDEKGELHFSSSPPPEGIEYTAKGYDPNTNLLQSVKIQTEEPEQPEAEKQSQIQKASDIGNPYSPAKVDKLIKDAQNIEKLLNDRVKKQETLIN
ncbi:MAG: DUF4124 domain-containing protein [Gammaproteobacteria bacterium]|nr:DUF4124 domain-containing protein [Gammaproteobacteria bacterium]